MVGSWKTLQLGKSCNKYDTDEYSKAVTYCDTGEFGDATEYDGSFTANDDADVNDVADVYDGVDVYDGADVTSTISGIRIVEIGLCAARAQWGER
ncbi:hypothetical protein PInf_021358 [Phytophthora infestans]|nr:hypothetical protein PInf_021358 [Phytophthora infestans]